MFVNGHMCSTLAAIQCCFVRKIAEFFCRDRLSEKSSPDYSSLISFSRGSIPISSGIGISQSVSEPSSLNS